jgi:proline iminopeptidase
MKSALRHHRIGETDAWIIGTGKPLIIIHGGPGLDHTYLVDPLLPLSNSRKLVFYNQFGCGKEKTNSSDLNSERFVAQFIELLSHFTSNGSADILAHSWGAYIFYSAVSQNKSLKVDSAIFVSPVGLTKKRFDNSGERLISRIPQEVLSQVTEMEISGNGKGVMNLIAPFYLGKKNCILQFKFYNPEVNNSVIGSLGDYDFRNAKGIFPKKSYFIYGDHDIEIPADTVEVHDNELVIIISESGHFSFVENSKCFIDSVQIILK